MDAQYTKKNINFEVDSLHVEQFAITRPKPVHCMPYVGLSAKEPCADALQAFEHLIKVLDERIRCHLVWRWLKSEDHPRLFTDLSHTDCLDDMTETHCMAFAMTLGTDYDQWLMRQSVSFIQTEFYADALGNAILFQMHEQWIRTQQAQYLEQGWSLIDSIFPGSAKLEIDMQAQLCALLDTRRKIGLSYHPTSYALVPQKSLIGLLIFQNRTVSKGQLIDQSSNTCRHCSSRHSCYLKQAKDAER